MHGFIILEFEKFIFTAHGFPVWRQIVQEAGLEGQEYTAAASYPDEEIYALMKSAVEVTGTEKELMLRRFGAYLVPNLLRVYKAYLDPTWTVMDLLEHAEKTMHASVRLHDSSKTPPILEVQRVSPREVVIDYRSPRKLAALAVGILEGIATYYGELDRTSIELTPDGLGQGSRITVRYR